jgi:GT2 family glycosyltransferase
VTSVAVLVPTWRRPRDLARCLDALRAQERAPDRVLVVRRPEDQETRAVLGKRDDPRLQEVLVYEPGQVAALNAGLAEVREDVVAITDDDTVAWRDWIRRIAEHFDRDPELGALGGRDWLYREGALVDGSKSTIGRVTWYGRFAGFHHLGKGAVREVDFLKGANMSFRRAAAAPLRFNSGLRGSGAEYLNDWDFTLALKASGWKLVYDPAVALDHHEGIRAGSQGRIKAGARTSDDRAVAAVKAFNETYIALRHLPAHRAAVHALFAVSVGTRQAPGLLIALVRAKHIGGKRAAVREVRNSVPARIAGMRAGLKARARDRAASARAITG